QDNKSLMAEITSLKDLLSQSSNATEALKTREAEFNSKLDNSGLEHKREIETLNKELELIRQEYNSAESKIEQLTKEHAELRQSVQKNIEELNEAKEALVKRDTIEVDLKTHIEQLKSELAAL
ncbi:hypothetical protein OXX69_013649, partial [Metschnikowia pulcherrima]